MAEERVDDRLEMDDSEAERLVGLNSLMEELIKDAAALSKDLIEGIGAVGGAAAIMLTIVVIEGIFILANLWRGVLFVAATLLVMIPLLIFGVKMLSKFFDLRRRYARIYEIKNELEM